MNRVIVGVFVSLLFGMCSNVAFGKKHFQPFKQIPKEFWGVWCDTETEGASLSVYFKRVKKVEDCKTKQAIEITFKFLKVYNDDAESMCSLSNPKSANPGSFQGIFICANRNYESISSAMENDYELTFQPEGILRLRDMEQVK